mmetsp:Transcript_88077/g.201293  ORF Transcript_88077/g.201293 Transcript_88077/m.201293 type:complete len:279 (+) Transcript_88077:147-983(+)
MIHHYPAVHLHDHQALPLHFHNVHTAKLHADAVHHLLRQGHQLGPHLRIDGMISHSPVAQIVLPLHRDQRPLRRDLRQVLPPQLGHSRRELLQRLGVAFLGHLGHAPGGELAHSGHPISHHRRTLLPVHHLLLPQQHDHPILILDLLKRAHAQAVLLLEQQVHRGLHLLLASGPKNIKPRRALERLQHHLVLLLLRELFHVPPHPRSWDVVRGHVHSGAQDHGVGDHCYPMGLQDLSCRRLLLADLHCSCRINVESVPKYGGLTAAGRILNLDDPVVG